MKRLIIAFTFALLLTRCQDASKFRLVETEKFSITTPTEWRLVKIDGIDHSFTVLVTAQADTIYMNYGRDIEGFNETIKVHSMQAKAHFDSIDWPYRHEMVFSKDAVTEERQGIYLNEYYRYDTIGNKRAKVMLPKLAGLGHTGIYFDSINARGEQLVIIGENLDQATQDQLYQSFYTVGFKKTLSN